MRLMYLILNPQLTAHFLDNPSFDSQKVRKRVEWLGKEGLGFHCLFRTNAPRLFVNNLLRKQAESQLFVEHVCNWVQYCVDRNAGRLALCSTQRRRLRQQGNVLFNSHGEKELLLFNLKSIWETKRREKWKSVHRRVNERGTVQKEKHWVRVLSG